MIESLLLAGLIDKYNHTWAAGSTHFVQTGDCVDRGHDSIRILHFLDNLQSQAEAAGGRVTLLLGNHELEAIEGETRFVSQRELEALGREALGAPAEGSSAGEKDAPDSAALRRAGRREWRRRFGRSGPEGRSVRARRGAAAVAGSGPCRTLFAHAGVLPGLLRGGGVAGLNSRLERTAGGPAEHVAAAADRGLFGDGGPFWTRAFPQEPEARLCPKLRESLALAGAAERMVVGHTPQDGGAFLERCGGRLHVIDTGISRAYWGRASAWECRGGQAWEVTAEGRRKLRTPSDPAVAA